jgi:predicted nucleic acid-binding protein
VNILIDTNVLSETVQLRPDVRVMQRLGQAAAGTLFVSAISIGEIVYGIAGMPKGAKKRALTDWLSSIERHYLGHVLPVDTEVARIWGEITAACEAKGRAIHPEDGLIAATALRHGMHLMTRNTKDFIAAGVMLINPWEE